MRLEIELADDLLTRLLGGETTLNIKGEATLADAVIRFNLLPSNAKARRLDAIKKAAIKNSRKKEFKRISDLLTMDEESILAVWNTGVGTLPQTSRNRSASCSDAVVLHVVRQALEARTLDFLLEQIKSYIFCCESGGHVSSQNGGARDYSYRDLGSFLGAILKESGSENPVFWWNKAVSVADVSSKLPSLVNYGGRDWSLEILKALWEDHKQRALVQNRNWEGFLSYLSRSYALPDGFFDSLT